MDNEGRLLQRIDSLENKISALYLIIEVYKRELERVRES
jgi:hypothetical protein